LTGTPLAGCLLLLALTVLWGGNWPAMKLAVREIDPWAFRTVCLLVGGGGLLTLVRAGGHSLRVPPAERGPLALVALFNITGWHLCSAYGLTLIPAGRGAIIAYTMPLWTVLFGRLLIGERITRTRLAALGLGLAGLAVLVAPAAGALGGAPAGTLLVLGAAASWAIGTVLTKARWWTIPTGVLTGWQLVVGAIPIALGAGARLAAAGSGAVLPSPPPSVAALLGTGYSTVVGVIFCHWAWFRIVAILPAAVAALGTMGVPIVGLFAGALLLGEPVGARECLALVLVVAALGIPVGQLAGRNAESLPPRPAVPTARKEAS
jgi:drug/metabolite transporter (DMT)-like permease